MTALALALHILGAVVWVGGMFAIYMCLRPALGALEPPQRLRLMRTTFGKFFPWVWIAILLLLASGYWMVFMTFGGFAGVRVHVHLMQGIGSASHMAAERLRLMRTTFGKFFPWVWIAILLLLASGYWMVFMTFGGFAGVRVHVHLMQGIGWVMIVLFLWLFHDPWLKLKRAVEAGDWPTAGANLNRIRQIIAVNLPLGLIVVVIGASGRYWG